MGNTSGGAWKFCKAEESRIMAAGPQERAWRRPGGRAEEDVVTFLAVVRLFLRFAGRG